MYSFLATSTLQLIATNTFTADPKWPFYSLLPHLLTLSTYDNLGFIHTDSHAFTLHVIFLFIKSCNQLLAGTSKVKAIWILLKQETVNGIGISWVMCKSAPCSRQTTTPAPHHCFLQAGCPSCRPTNSIKEL